MLVLSLAIAPCCSRVGGAGSVAMPLFGDWSALIVSNKQD